MTNHVKVLMLTMEVKISAFVKGPNNFAAGPTLTHRPLFANHLVESTVFVSFLSLSKAQVRVSIKNLPLGPRVDPQ